MDSQLPDITHLPDTDSALSLADALQSKFAATLGTATIKLVTVVADANPMLTNTVSNNSYYAGDHFPFSRRGSPEVV